MNSGVEFLCAMNAFLDNGPGAVGPGSRTVDCHQEGESQLQSSYPLFLSSHSPPSLVTILHGGSAQFITILHGVSQDYYSNGGGFQS